MGLILGCRVNSLCRKGDRVIVRTPDGKTLNATAGTDISSQRVAVLVAENTNEVYVMAENASRSLTSKTTDFFKSRPEEETEETTETSPIKIFFRWTGETAPQGNGIYVGGDRETPALVISLENDQLNNSNPSLRGFYNLGRGREKWQYAALFNDRVFRYRSPGNTQERQQAEVFSAGGQPSTGQGDPDLTKGIRRFYFGAGLINLQLRVDTSITLQGASGQIYLDIFGNEAFPVSVTLIVSGGLGFTANGGGSRLLSLTVSATDIVESQAITSVNSSWYGPNLQTNQYNDDHRRSIVLGETKIEEFVTVQSGSDPLLGSGIIVTHQYLQSAVVGIDRALAALQEYTFYRSFPNRESTGVGQTVRTIETRIGGLILYSNVTTTTAGESETVVTYHESLENLSSSNRNTYLTRLVNGNYTQIIGDTAYTVMPGSSNSVNIYTFNSTDTRLSVRRQAIIPLPVAVGTVYAALYHP